MNSNEEANHLLSKAETQRNKAAELRAEADRLEYSADELSGRAWRLTYAPLTKDA